MRCSSVHAVMQHRRVWGVGLSDDAVHCQGKAYSLASAPRATISFTSPGWTDVITYNSLLLLIIMLQYPNHGKLSSCPQLCFTAMKYHVVLGGGCCHPRPCSAKGVGCPSPSHGARRLYDRRLRKCQVYDCYLV